RITARLRSGSRVRRRTGTRSTRPPTAVCGDFRRLGGMSVPDPTPSPDSVCSAVEVEALKADSFGRISLMRGQGELFVRRDLAHVPLWLRFPAWWLARREARGLQQVAGLGDVPRLLRW